MKNSDNVLLVGLGNPGLKYASTRHNIGFRFADFMARDLGVKFKEKNNYSASQKVVDGRKIYIIKPMLYMNLSGIPALHVASYYKIKSENIIIAYDDVDLPFGKNRIRVQGDAGGHNGIKSIIEQLGKSEFIRIRMGVDKHPIIPLERYVLANFSKEEEDELPNIMENAKSAFWEIFYQGSESAMNKYNG